MDRHFACYGRLFASSFAAAALLAGCGSGGGDDGGGSAGGGPPPPPPGGGNPSLQATFSSIQDNVFTPICTACHVGAAAPAGLRLDAANSYTLLVGVASSEVSGTLRVAPGNPNGSYLIQKLEGTASVGGRMPLNGTPLPQPDIDMIRQWITDGAQPAPAPGTPVKVTSLTPSPGSLVAALPPSITAGFDRELNAASVTSGTFLLDRSGGDGTFDDGNEVAVAAASVTVPAANTSSAVLDLAGAANVEDTYRVRLLGSGGAVVMDLGGNALDGELASALPSGDGAAGGDFVATFIVAATQPTLQSIQTNVFGPRCSGCHTGPTSATLPAGMDLTSAAASFASLVGVTSLEASTLERVKIGDPANSYLIHKLEGTQTTGGRMPLIGEPLNQPTIAAIRQWITDGANQ